MWERWCFGALSDGQDMVHGVLIAPPKVDIMIRIS